MVASSLRSGHVDIITLMPRLNVALSMNLVNAASDNPRSHLVISAKAIFPSLTDLNNRPVSELLAGVYCLMNGRTSFARFMFVLS